jgi:Cu+-exporting ATPase
LHTRFILVLDHMSETPAEAVVEHLDPVCGMTVEPSDAAGTYEYQGRTYYFCNPTCLEQFAAAPDAFVSAASDITRPESRPVAGVRRYICPMDPEVARSEPGACP